ncbi:hypothetical protein [Rhodanobacter sp. L36]|uniref:hypothetical protein n=1 Tax=Rhodanobacter sp. L36 TaxID=1747221 RepID=UPI00131C4A06|nr:hypothetical protein [Rhodanobacter sp. L36]
MYSPLLHRLREFSPHVATSDTRCCVQMAPATLARSLPALGNLLYVPMHPHASTSWIVPRGLLLEAMQLAPLLQIRWLVAASVITVDGPREWIDGIDRDGHVCARLYLLPDTDYLAWDALLASGEPASIPARRWRRPRPASAQLVCFRHRRMAGLEVFSATSATPDSPLSAQLVARIARTEAFPWPSEINH